MVKKLSYIIFKASLFLIGIILLLFLALQLPPIQNAIARKVVHEVRDNLNIPLSIEQVSITFFNRVKLKNVVLRTPHNDTIVYAADISAGLNLHSLLDNRIHVRKLGLKGVDLNFVNPAGDSLLNIAAIFREMPEREKNTEDTAQSLPELTLDRLILKDINFHYEDKNTQNSVNLQLDNFELRCNLINLIEQTIELDEIEVNGARMNMTQSAIQPTDGSEPFPYQISLENELRAEHIHVNIDNKITKQKMAVHNLNLAAKLDSLNLAGKYIDFQKIALNNTSVRIVQGLQSRSDSLIIDSLQALQPDSGFNWRIQSKQLKLDQNNFFLSNNSPSNTDGINESVQLKNIGGDIQQIEIRNNFYSANINNFMINVNDQISVKDMSALAKINNHSASVENFTVKTAASSVQLNVRMNYHNLANLKKQLHNTGFYMDVKAEIGSKDLARYLPESSLLTQHPEIIASGTFSGKIQQFTMDSFNITASDMLAVSLQGEINGMPDYNRSNVNININRLTINSDAIKNYTSDTLLPEGIQLPKNIDIQGGLNGTSEYFKTNLSILTSYGNVNTTLKLNMDSIPEQEYFTSRFEVDSFDVGRLISNPDTIGHLSLKGEINGHTTGFTDPQLAMDMTISRAGYLGYDYQNIGLKGEYRKRFFNGVANINDENIALRFSGKVDMTDTIPELNFITDVPYARLQHLNLASKPTEVSGKLFIDINGREWNKLKGSLKADSLQFVTENQNYALDRLSVNLKQQPDTSRYKLIINSLYQNDSLISGLSLMDALIHDNKANISYQIWDAKPVNDTGRANINGLGEVMFTDDTLQFNNQLAIHTNRHNLPDNLELNMNFSRIRREKGIQDVLLKMEGTGASIHAKGSIESGRKEDWIEAEVAVDSLNLLLAKPFTRQQLKKINGYIRGSLDVSGPMSNADINGELRVVNTTVNPKALNTDFIFENEKILVNNSLITFNNLTIRDEAGNMAVLDGQVDIDEKATNNLNFTFTADQFRLLNKSAATSGLYYGNVIVNVDASVSGSFENPVISINTAFKDKSKFHFIVPQQKAQVQKQKGIIQFVEKAEKIDTTQTTRNNQLNLQSSGIKNIEVTSNLEITENFRLTVVTNPATDDKLEIAGNGNLNFTINKSGNMSLAGRYEILSGKYRLKLYDFLTREFEIEKGSYLSWSGDLLEPNANIKAIYKLRTSTNTLLPGTGQGNTGIYQRTIPIEVVMNLSGNLLTPQIDFDIRADQSIQSGEIQALLNNVNQNESEVNKQAFSLLLFNRFSSEAPGGSSAVSYNLQNTAMESLSNVISEQLNRFSGQYIKGVDVSFDIDAYRKMMSDNASTQTNVNVDFSKNLFSDRLTIELGGRVAVDEGRGETENAVSANNLAGDFKVEYKLTPDGTYRLQAFNQTEYEDELEGEVTKTGLSLIFNKDFTRLNDLFRPNIIPNDTLK
ncbi:MAG: hypothetical protein GVY19_00635 [Bacteroidetes bacterium]|jgi:hypothetical protein|nr:hypothetical protein [Bacteroidota bacterium]